MKKQKQAQSETGLHICMQSGLSVTKRVEDGKTAFFHDKESAQKHANQKRSYVYDAFDGKGNPIGHCVPN